MGALGVVDVVEFVDLTLQLGDGGGDGLLVEPAEHGLMEPFVLALGRGTARAAGDRLDTQAGDVAHQLAVPATPRRVQRHPVIGEQSLRDTPGGDAVPDHCQRGLAGFPGGDQRRDREP